MVLRIRFPNSGTLWAGRIPSDQEYSFHAVSIQPLMFIARNHPSLSAPRLHGYFDAGAAGDNPVGVAYMLVDWIEGEPMPPWSLKDPPVLMRRKVLDQLAEIILEMLSLTTFDGDILFYGKFAALRPCFCALIDDKAYQTGLHRTLLSPQQFG